MNGNSIVAPVLGLLVLSGTIFIVLIVVGVGAIVYYIFMGTGAVAGVGMTYHYFKTQASRDFDDMPNWSDYADYPFPQPEIVDAVWTEIDKDEQVQPADSIFDAVWPKNPKDSVKTTEDLIDELFS